MSQPKKMDAYQTRGAKIMQLADEIRPALLKTLAAYRDENGMPFSPERVRGYALNMAQFLIKKQELNAV